MWKDKNMQVKYVDYHSEEWNWLIVNGWMTWEVNNGKAKMVKPK